ncbi:MAG TPA: hypothetical protein DD640_07040 [Clostridiales bacterium]|nr:hypothetical protein [Clostridiales bacterium]
MDKLAISGGIPVRVKPWPTSMLGASLIGEEELNELRDVVAEKSPFRFYGLGNPAKTATLEKELKDYFGCKFALAVSSGSAALVCAVAALGLGPGDEVILSAFTWYSDYNALVNFGVLPVFADIDESLDLDPADFARKITPRTKAVIVVHFQGGAARMDEICRIARAHDIKIIEDCAQALGGGYKGARLGTFGDVSILSFQVHKVLTAGEGGALLTNHEEYFVRAVRYHDLGLVRSYFTEQLADQSLADAQKSFAGLQFRMSELQGAFLLAQFRKLDQILGRCRLLHQKVRDHFSQNQHFRIRYTDGDCGIAIFLLFATAGEADQFRKCLEAEGIQVGAASACSNLLQQYPIKSQKLVHDALPPFGSGFAANISGFSPESCPNTNLILGRYLAISIGPQFTDEDVMDIITAIDKVDANLYQGGPG